VRVGVDGRGLAAAARTGVEQYVVGLTRALAEVENRPEMIAYLDRPIADEALAGALAGRIETKVVRARYGWLRAALPWRLWRDGVDVVHLPSTVMPPVLPCPAVVTVHDLAWKRYPETYSAEDLAMQTSRAAGSIRRAAHVLAVSETTARDLRELLRVPDDRITVTPLAASHEFSPEGSGVPEDAFRGAERLDHGYVLYAGGLSPRKNLMRLLEAYSEMKREVEAPPLVLPGSRSEYADELARRADELGLGDRVVFPGYVEQALMPALYRGATVFVYPSLYEGFGLPVLEAMASGVPVVTSNRGGTAEVAGEAAVLVEPESTEAIAAALRRLLGDEELRGKVGAGGLRRSRGYRWELTARETVAVYGRAAGSA